MSEVTLTKYYTMLLLKPNGPIHFDRIYTKVFQVDENIFHSFQTKQNKFLLNKIQHQKLLFIKMDLGSICI